MFRGILSLLILTFFSLPGAAEAKLRVVATSTTLGSLAKSVGGDDVEVSYEPFLTFQMSGVGYRHPVWGHGMWKGELAIAGESWREEDLDPMAFDNQHIQQVVRARHGDQVGVGVLEQIAFGPHHRYGFTDLLDPAP